MAETLAGKLIKEGLSQVQSEVLEIAFGTQVDFISGMNAVVTFLAMDEAPDYQPPQSQPWADIWDAINNDPDNKLQVFTDIATMYPDNIRDTLINVISTKVQNKRIWLSALGSGNNQNKTPEYYMSILSHLGYQFRLNECTQTVEVNGKAINDFIAAGIRSKARAAGVREMKAVEDAYSSYAWEHKYNPVRRYLEHLTFAGGDPIDELGSYFKDEKNMFSLFLRRWLIGAVARSFQGCRNRVLVLDGDQHIGKSAFVRWLGSPMIEYFKEGAILPDDKDCRLSLISTWIWEVSEWGTVARRQDREALKAFISTVDVKDRAAYGKHAMQGRAISSFIATANNEMGLFNDPTGTSRFMTCHVTAIDWKGYTRAIDIDQVWAQAYNLWLNKEPWELSDVELAAATEINNDYQMIDIVEETCHQLFEIDPGNKTLWMSSLDIMNYLKNDGNLKSGIEIDMRKMASALTKMGLDRPKQKRVAGRIERGYVGIRRLP